MKRANVCQSVGTPLLQIQKRVPNVLSIWIFTISLRWQELPVSREGPPHQHGAQVSAWPRCRTGQHSWPHSKPAQSGLDIWRHINLWVCFISLPCPKTRPHREPSLSLPSQRLCLQDINRCSDLGWRIALEAMVMWNIPWPGALLVWYSLKLSPIPHLTWR